MTADRGLVRSTIKTHAPAAASRDFAYECNAACVGSPLFRRSCEILAEAEADAADALEAVMRSRGIFASTAAAVAAPEKVPSSR